MMPWKLGWKDVDPAMHPFGATKDAVAKVALPGVPLRDGKVEGWEPDVTARFMKQYGAWACGWCWSVGEGTLGGGPVSGWCCAPHSYTTQAETAQRCAAGLLDWRGWIESLEKAFVEIDEPARAGSSLVTLVAEKTDASDAWYGHCEQVLEWFLESRGAEPKSAANAAKKALEGRFGSWVTPDEATLAAVAETFAPQVERFSRKKR